MTLRVWGVIVGGALTMAIALACSQPFCPYGFYPFPGQSGVPLDTVIEIQASQGFAPDVPSLGEAAGLEEEDGTVVPVSIEVDIERGTLRLIPEEPLKPDTNYRAWGLDASKVDRLRWQARFPDHRSESSFTTASAPQLVEAYADEERLIVAFTEPVDVDSLRGRLFWEQDGAQARAIEVLGNHAGAGHLVALQRPSDMAERDAPLLVLAEGALTEDGVEIPAIESGVRRYQGSDPGLELRRDLAAHLSLPRCGVK